MKYRLISRIQKLLLKFGMAVVPKQIFLRNRANPEFLLLSRWFLYKDHHELSSFVLQNFYRSKSQLQQDIVALYISELCQKKYLETSVGGSKDKFNRFFVEFGATNGLSLSNTYLLEKDFGWDGILAEPAKLWHEDLFRNRQCTVDTRCVFSKSGINVEFNETQLPELSTIASFALSDIHAESRKGAKVYKVETVSLHDLLVQNGASRNIQYMSIDTEGSEIEILKEFNFSDWEIDFITVEVTSDSKLNELLEIMNAQGYRQVLSMYSEWEAWFLRDDLLQGVL